MTDNHTELCERLRQASVQCSDCGMYETSSDFDLAVSMIESQAARIQQQALECVSLFDQCSAHLARIAELEKEREALKVDAERLDWLIEQQAWIQWTLRDGSIRQCQVYDQDEDENYHILSGEDLYFNTPREAIDAALKAEKETRS